MQTITQVGIGVHVEIDLIDSRGDAERMAFDIVRDEAADFDQGLLGTSTVLAKAILGKFVGAVVPYTMGDMHSLKIVSVQPSQQSPDLSAARRRQAIIDQAVEKANQTNAEIFASSFTSKWGGYDAGGDTKWESEK